MTQNLVAETLAHRIAQRTAKAGVIGLGYVGLPLAAAAAKAGFTTIGFDIDRAKVEMLNAGRSYIDAVGSDELAAHVAGGRFTASDDFDRLGECDVIAIAVPTPLSRQREPDLGFVVATAEAIAARLRPGQLVVLESTTWPGTTEEVLKPILERGGLASGRDFFLAFSPEREDPGNANFRTVTIPKIVAGEGEEASALVKAFYGAVVEKVVAVSSPKVAEAVKITENVFRAVNIALVNELKVVYDAMGIDVWEVIDAAATKPFGYMPFYPGPGLGGHCIPIDPFYLTWKSREFGLPTRFIELAGEINVAMPRYVVSRLEQALDRTQKVSLGSATVLILGLAYKKNVSDIRESPSLELMEILAKRGTEVLFHDPFVDSIPKTRAYGHFAGRPSTALSAEQLSSVDAVVVATDHDALDYRLVAESARLIVDTRNAFARRGIEGSNIVKA
ncbi:nucleotide sugar dehydrogenase [Shinella sp. S4-D37]|uniref:nucleotide sugar dehydrogenase n=1 Tax=Shinella sp. S4-D37 TaxID=3161999 RepID=UPI00346669B2